MKKILALALPLIFLTLMSIPAGNAVVTPVEVERVKGVYFLRVRGDHHTASFLLHYVNLSPETQVVTVGGTIWPPDGPPISLISEMCSVPPGDAIDSALRPGGYGWTLTFTIRVGVKTIVITGSVVIPPPP